MASPDTVSTDPSAPAPDKASVWEDFLDIFYEPSQVFRRRAEGNFWIPMLMVAVLMGALAYANRNIMRPVFDAEFARNMTAAMQKNPQLTQDAVNKMKDFSFTVAQYGTVLMIPIMILVLAFVVWVLVKAFGARISWNAALIVTSFAMIARVVQQVAISVQGLILDPAHIVSRFSVQVGPGRFMNADTVQPVVGAVMDHLDVFVLWGVVLTAIGVAVIGKLPKAKAWAFGVTFWVVTLLPALYAAWKTM